jgi:sugar-specific transcriptional regulator TrmB
MKRTEGSPRRWTPQEIEAFINRMLDEAAEHLRGSETTLSEFIKLLQVKTEVTKEQRPHKVEVKWVESLPENGVDS